MKHIERNFWLDIGLLATFLSAACTGLPLWLHSSQQAAVALLGLDRQTWLTAHICSAVASVAGCVVHIIWHRMWLKALRKRSIASLPARLRSNRVTDRFIWIAFLATFVFGAINWMIPARANSLSIAGSLHVGSGVILLLGITLHLALHSKWISSATRQHLQVQRGEMVMMQPGGAKD